MLASADRFARQSSLATAAERIDNLHGRVEHDGKVLDYNANLAAWVDSCAVPS